MKECEEVAEARGSGIFRSGSALGFLPHSAVEFAVTLNWKQTKHGSPSIYLNLRS